MKKVLSKVLSIILLLTLLFSDNNILVSEAVGFVDNNVFNNYSLSNIIPDNVSAFALENYKDLIEASLPYYTCLYSDDLNDYYLEEPFIIYSNSNSPTIYYYPVSLNNQIVFLISIVNTSYGLSISGSEEMTDGLNSISYIENNNEYIFYENGPEINVETNNSDTIVLEQLPNYENSENQVDDSFLDLNFEQKKQKVYEQAKFSETLDIDSVKVSSMTMDEEGYYPAFSTLSPTNYTCLLYNQKGQGNYPICWAASVATIVNYRKGTNYSATDICDSMNLPYTAQNINVKKDALSKYGLNYQIRTRQLTYSEIKTNLSNRLPIAASTFTGGSNSDGHAVTVYGCNMPSVTEYIIIWNSGTNSSQTLYYNPNGSTYSYANKTWTWTKSLSGY